MNWRAVAPSMIGAATIGLWGCGGAEDAGEADAAAHDPHGGGGAFTQTANGIELFVEYPHQIQGVESEEAWEIHLTRVEDWQPVVGANVTVVMYGPRGAREEFAAAPGIAGVYAAVPTASAAGEWLAEFAVSVDGRGFTIPGGPFEVFGSEDEVDLHAGHSHGDEADPEAEDEAAAAGLIILAKAEQWSFPFGVAVAEEREIPASIPVAGELVAPPGGLVHVSSPVAGLVAVDGPSIGPGDRVSAGQTLALIAPTSLDNSYVRTRADVIEAQLEADRAERLYAAGAIPQRRLLDARRNLDVAVAAFEAIGGTLDSVGDEEPDPDLYYLRCPIDGVVTVRDVALGAQVETGQHAFTIVDASSLWFVARLPARYAADANRIRGAWFTVEGGADAFTTNRVLSIGSMIDPSNRTLPVRFGVGNPGGALKVGMLAEGNLLLGEPMQGVAVPASAIQDENNLQVIYVMRTGDTFERRVVETGPSDGSWTIVRSGLAAGERVVTAGAYQVSLAVLGVIEPAHDHAH